MKPSNTRTYRVRTQSGIWGWRCLLRVNYGSFADFEAYDGSYNLAKRLGYRTARAAWRANPVIEGSVNPGDFRRVSI